MNRGDAAERLQLKSWGAMIRGALRLGIFFVCVASIVAIIQLKRRSELIEDRVFFYPTAGYDYRAVVSARGFVYLELLTHTPPLRPYCRIEWVSTPLPYPSYMLQFYAMARNDNAMLAKFGIQRCGFSSKATPYDAGADLDPAARNGFMQYNVWWVPHWLATIPFLVPPLVIAIGALHRRRRLTTGLCPECGYDLRASPERCPECGRAVPKTAT
jgi:hypothetical protein